ncbi:MAG: aminomethyl-transferring glycine dehydrogenase subunit GcvPB [Actinomycetota bacterium]|nr:aminomethyl-transferring glycine dehydrogenase subunit GcvPB [Actinomycetota bacterium]
MRDQRSSFERAPAGGRASSAPVLSKGDEPTIFELSVPSRTSWSLRNTNIPEYPLEELVPAEHLRSTPPDLAEVSERDLVAHFTRLSQRQYSVDTGAYPLGSCTMKYNPKVCDAIAALSGLADVHPASPPSCTQGWLRLFVELEEVLCEITGMAAVTMQPAAGAAGELTGLLLMRAWHESLSSRRHRVIIPDSAHGTNPASVALAGYEVTTVASDSRGCVDLERLREVLDDDVAGIMLTNPNTLGLFEEGIIDIAAAAHDVGALLYYDGANLNAILGVTRPGDMGFDIVHLNLHKTFATPHGGGGPGAGPVAVSERLVEFLPGPRPVRLLEPVGRQVAPLPHTAGPDSAALATRDSLPSAGPDGTNGQTSHGYREGDRFGWSTPERSIGRMHSWHGNALVLARAYAYILANGADGLRRVADMAVLNANWLRKRLRGVYDMPYDRPVMHELVVSAARLRKLYGVKAVDVAKRLLEEGFHSPTVAFPLIVDDALMIEPTETESPQTVAALAEAMERIAAEVAEDNGAHDARLAPRTTPVGRVDEALAARKLVPTWDLRERQQTAG